LRALELRSELTPLAQFERRLCDRHESSVLLLVIRLPALERTAWREGLRKARTLERNVSNAFTKAAAGVLRSGDCIAHEPGSDIFVAALTAPTRDGGNAPLPIDARTALARICATVEGIIRLDVDAGWTDFTPSGAVGEISVAIAQALLRGAQERERYGFFSALGHELRTPLSSIRGYLETLLEDAVDLETRMRFLKVAYNESLRLSRLIDGMFEISLLDLQTATRGACTGNLARTLEAVCDACFSSAAARSIDLSCDAAAPVLVQMDSDRLTLVLVNLVENAIKHGRVNGRVEIRVARTDEREVRLSIDDDGAGIIELDRKRIFTLGERGPTSAAGSGIGLALVRLMLERDGGSVEVTDSPLGGARFVVIVPRAAPIDNNGVDRPLSALS